MGAIMLICNAKVHYVQCMFDQLMHYQQVMTHSYAKCSPLSHIATPWPGSTNYLKILVTTSEDCWKFL